MIHLETNTSIRLYLLHDGSTGQPDTPIACITPKRSVVRQLIPPQAAIEIPTSAGPEGNTSMSGVRTAVAASGHFSGVRSGAATAETRAHTVRPVLGTRQILPAIFIPGMPTNGTMTTTGNSFDLLPAIRMTMTSDANSTSFSSTEAEVQILDVCSLPQCGDRSSSMKSCGQCQKFMFCGKQCDKKCPCLDQSHKIVSGRPVTDNVILNPVDPVGNSWSVTHTCKYCGTQVQSADPACSVCYHQYCLRSCTCVVLEFVIIKAQILN